MRPRRAFALPTVILVMLILVGALASGFGMLTSERGADDAAIQSQAAAALAETGLQQGLRNRPGLGLSAVPGASDSVRLALTGGYADIVTTRLRAASGTTVAAVAVPDVPGYSGSLTPLTGTPKVQSLGATAAAASTTVPFDWADIVSGNAITPDFLSDYLGNGFPTTGWFASNGSSWPTIIVNNGPSPNREFTLSSFGRGLLIVYGDLRLNGNSAGWNGIIITGGKIRSNGSNQVSGATITGLNVKLGYAVTATDVDELMGTKRYLYNSCNVGSALNSLGALRVYQNSWANTFPSY